MPRHPEFQGTGPRDEVSKGAPGWSSVSGATQDNAFHHPWQPVKSSQVRPGNLRERVLSIPADSRQSSSIALYMFVPPKTVLGCDPPESIEMVARVLAATGVYVGLGHHPSDSDCRAGKCLASCKSDFQDACDEAEDSVGLSARERCARLENLSDEVPISLTIDILCAVSQESGTSSVGAVARNAPV
jgi:hypothetical protein